jgi:hypothetical protein
MLLPRGKNGTMGEENIMKREGSKKGREEPEVEIEGRDFISIITRYQHQAPASLSLHRNI